MKTALICMMQLHKSSGSARTALENIRYFQARGFKVHVMSMTIDKSLINNSEVTYHRALPWIKSTGLLRRKWYNFQVQLLRKKLKPDITVGHGDIIDQDFLTLHNSVFLASELIHNKPLTIDHEMAQTHGRILREQKFKTMIANSHLMKNDAIKRFNISPQKITVVYPALDTKVFYPLKDKQKIEQRKRFKFDERVVVSLVTSGNFKKRGLDIFIEAINLISPEIQKKANFRVLGKDEEGKYQHPLIQFDPGLNDIQNYFNAIDVFVLPARIEEFGRVVLEAMGCGLPVITTNKVGAGELLTEASKEFVIPSHSAEALAKGLEKLINSSSLRQNLGKLNFELAQNESEDKLYAKFDRVFLDIKQ